MSHQMSILVFMCVTSIFASEGFPNRKCPVGSKQNPGKSCKDIKAHGGTVTDNYYIGLNGRTVQVHCDQTTAGGGWTLVYSFTFTDFDHFSSKTNSVTPSPTWPIDGNVPISTTPPLSETDYNAMDFKLWKAFGNEFMIKSNINNWIACSDGTGSLVNWRSGDLRCKMIKNVVGKCGEIVPDMIMTHYYNGGPNIYNRRVASSTILCVGYYYLNTSADGEFAPALDPCGGYITNEPAMTAPNPHGNIYIR